MYRHTAVDERWLSTERIEQNYNVQRTTTTWTNDGKVYGTGLGAMAPGLFPGFRTVGLFFIFETASVQFARNERYT